MSILFVLSLITLAFGLKLDIENLDQPYMPDEYIITYHENTTDELASSHWDLMDSVGVEFIHKYNAGAHKGFAAKITNEKVVSALREDPLVAAIQVNGFAYANQGEHCNTMQQNTPSWGLARISHPGDVSKGLVNRMHHGINDGAGVEVFVIDTGIMTTHVDFQGRAKWGKAFADGGSEDDRNGHGTHCAGTIGGHTYGVAKRATLIAVKVLGASGGGTWADVVAGVDYCANTGVPGRAVGSMSLGGAGSNAALTSAINNCVNKGIPMVVAAGNSNANACSYTPSGIPSVISVGSCEIAGFEPDEFDSRSSFSNFGTCVHVFAPGRDITSTWIGSNTASSTISGTSMACPHVAGYAASLLSRDPTLSPQAIRDIIQTSSQKDLIANPGTGSPNYLLYNQCPNN